MTDHLRIVGLIMKHKPFQVDIKSRGPRFSKAIHEAQTQYQSRTDYDTLDISDVTLNNI